MIGNVGTPFKKLVLSAALGIGFLFLFAFPQLAAAAVECDFSRDLEFGMDGEDVRCLQQYLNDAGFTVAATGVGAPGEETTLFRTLTEEALIRWQEANDISPAVGYFGPVSRASYLTLLAADLEDKLAEAQGDTGAPKPPSEVAGASTDGSAETASKNDAERDAAEEIINDAMDMIEDAQEQIEDEDVDEEDLRDARERLFDATRDLFRAVNAFFDRDYDDAVERAEDVFDDAEEAFEDAGGETVEDEADQAIEDAEDAIDDAEDAIEDAIDDGDDVDDAEELLDEAEDLLDDAEDAFDDEDYDEAIDLAKDAEDLAYDAIDEL